MRHPARLHNPASPETRSRANITVEEDFEFGKDCFGLDQCQARLYTAILRHAVAVMAALAICAVTAALVKDRTDTQAPPPVRPGQPPPPEPGMIPLTIPEIKRLLAGLTTRSLPRWHVIHWDAWTAATRPAHDGSTNAPDSPATSRLPWSASEMRLPYSGLGSDAPPLLLKAATRLEPLNLDQARETYLSAWMAALFAGRLGGPVDLLEVSRAARALPPVG